MNWFHNPTTLGSTGLILNNVLDLNSLHLSLLCEK